MLFVIMSFSLKWMLILVFHFFQTLSSQCNIWNQSHCNAAAPLIQGAMVRQYLKIWKLPMQAVVAVTCWTFSKSTLDLTVFLHYQFQPWVIAVVMMLLQKCRSAYPLRKQEQIFCNIWCKFQLIDLHSCVVSWTFMCSCSVMVNTLVTFYQFRSLGTAFLSYPLEHKC